MPLGKFCVVLICVLSLIIKSGTSVHLYTIIIYVDIAWQYTDVHICYWLCV